MYGRKIPISSGYWCYAHNVLRLNYYPEVRQKELMGTDSDNQIVSIRPRGDRHIIYERNEDETCLLLVHVKAMTELRMNVILQLLCISKYTCNGLCGPILH